MTYVDLALIGVHFIFMLVLKMSYIMWVPILVIRVPRVFLHLAAKRRADKLWHDREYLFRKHSVWAYFLLALVCQVINMFGNVCRSTEVLGTVNECYSAFMTTIIVLLILNFCVDIMQFLTVKKRWEAKMTEFGVNKGANEFAARQPNNMI